MKRRGSSTRARTHHVLAMLLVAASAFRSAGANEGSVPTETDPSGSLTIGAVISDVLDLPRPRRAAAGMRDDATLELSGSVNNAMWERFSKAIAVRDIRRVRITSHGGEAVSGLRIATEMQARGIDVVVHGLCFGPCAQYLFVAGRRRILERNALVAFHESITGSRLIADIATRALGLDNPLQPLLQQYAAAEE